MDKEARAGRYIHYSTGGAARNFARRFLLESEPVRKFNDRAILEKSCTHLLVSEGAADVLHNCNLKTAWRVRNTWLITRTRCWILDPEISAAIYTSALFFPPRTCLAQKDGRYRVQLPGFLAEVVDDFRDITRSRRYRNRFCGALCNIRGLPGEY